MKAIILTNAPVTDYEKDLIRKTDIFKLALNHHAKELFPDARIITDYVLDKICRSCTERIITVRDSLRYFSDRVEYFNIGFKGSTMVAALEYLISKGFDNILIIGDNTVHSAEFQLEVKTETDKIKGKVRIYQYSDGNFNLPVKNVKEFVSEN